MVLQISDKISALDMENQLTYLGQFVGKFNTGLTNYITYSTFEIIKLSKKNKKTALETMREIYQNAKKQGNLNRDIVKIPLQNKVAYYPDIFGKRD